MSLFRTEKMLNVHFPHFLLSAFLSLSIIVKTALVTNNQALLSSNLGLSSNNLGLLRKKAGLFEGLVIGNRAWLKIWPRPSTTNFAVRWGI